MIIPCLRVMDKYLVTPGSERMIASCAHEVWVSPVQAQHVREGAARLVCVQCVGRADTEATKIQELCRTARRLAGPNYEREIDVWRQLIRAAMKKHACGALEAATHAIALLQHKGFRGEESMAWLTSAAMDVANAENVSRGSQ